MSAEWDIPRGLLASAVGWTEQPSPDFGFGGTSYNLCGPPPCCRSVWGLAPLGPDGAQDVYPGTCLGVRVRLRLLVWPQDPGEQRWPSTLTTLWWGGVSQRTQAAHTISVPLVPRSEPNRSWCGVSRRCHSQVSTLAGGLAPDWPLGALPPLQVLPCAVRSDRSAALGPCHLFVVRELTGSSLGWAAGAASSSPVLCGRPGSSRPPWDQPPSLPSRCRPWLTPPPALGPSAAL